MKCYLKPISVLVLCISPAIIILIKSQNLLLAFKSKTIVDDSDKRNSNLIQFSVVALIILFNGSVLLWSTITNPPVVQLDINHSKYQIVMECNTGLHINLQIAMLIFQYLFTSVQAYRGRNLPGPFNEAMPIAYSTLTVVFTCLVVFPLFYLQNDIELRQSIHLVILSTAQTLFLIIFYGPKIYVILCQKHKNTKAYLREKMWRDAKEKAETEIQLKR